MGSVMVRGRLSFVVCGLLLVAAVLWEAAPAGAGFTETPAFVAKWGSFGSGNGQFQLPRGIAVDSSRNVYVADHLNDRIQKFTSAGTFFTQWGGFGSGNGQFNHPNGVAVDASGNVYVSDQNNHRIQKFDSTGTFIATWGSNGTGNGQFASPAGVAVDASGNVYVVDQVNNRVQKFTSTGAFITKWGSFGSGDGQFDLPWGVAVDGSGNVFVTGPFNSRIQKFTSTGAFITKWGSFGVGDGQFNAVRGVAVDGAGNVYTADQNNHRIQKFTANGTFITAWGSTGTGNGQFATPLAVAVNDSGNVYVADTGNHRIQRFSPQLHAPHHRVGIGTTDPVQPLHVARSDGSARILVQDTTAVTARRFLMDLENNGPTGMHLTNTNTAASWEFATAGQDNFVISLVGTGGNEFNLAANGQLRIGPGNTTQMLLTPTGDLTVDGTITDGSGTTLGDLAAENQALRDRIAELETRLDSLQALLGEQAEAGR